MAKYQLNIKTLQGYIIKPIVDKYDLNEGLISFLDPKDNTYKSFPISSCEIVVISK
jgi:hypothetical protein